MGLLAANAYAPGQGMPMRPQFGQPPPQQQQPMPQMQPPQMPQGGGGMLGAFSQNPAFMQQLQSIQAGQGPGFQQPQFTPPISPMSMSPSGGADLWHDGIDGNARAAGLKKPARGGGFNLGAGLLGGGMFGALSG